MVVSDPDLWAFGIQRFQLQLPSYPTLVGYEGIYLSLLP